MGERDRAIRFVYSAFAMVLLRPWQIEAEGTIDYGRCTFTPWSAPLLTASCEGMERNAVSPRHPPTLPNDLQAAQIPHRQHLTLEISKYTLIELPST